jgi:uncharacterized protein
MNRLVLSLTLLVATSIPTVTSFSPLLGCYRNGASIASNNSRRPTRRVPVLTVSQNAQPDQQHESPTSRVPSDNKSDAKESSIADKVTAEMKLAMKAKDQIRLNTIRLIRTAFANAAIENRVASLSDEQAVAALFKLAKMRQDAIGMYTDGGALDRAQAEQVELSIIQTWLPTLADEKTTRQWVDKAIEDAGGVDNVGKIMGALMKKHKKDIDGTLAQRIVKEQVAKFNSPQ